MSRGVLKVALIACMAGMMALPSAVRSCPIASGTVTFENTDMPPLFFRAFLDFTVYAPGHPDNPVPAGTYPSVVTDYTYVYSLANDDTSLVPLDGLDIELQEGVVVSASGSLDDGDPATVAPSGITQGAGVLSFDFFAPLIFPNNTTELFFITSPSAPGDIVLTAIFDGTSEDELGPMAGPAGTGAIAGHIEAFCEVDPPAVGVTVDLYTSENQLVESSSTDESGDYIFDEIPAGDYLVTIVTPLGYNADEEEKPATVVVGDTTIVNFQLTCVPADPTCFLRRTRAYWKHQVNFHIRGWHCWARESMADLSTYMELIRIHFNENALNPVEILEVDAGSDSLRSLRRLLTVNCRETMRDRAKAQMVALLLNVVSNRLHQHRIISVDGANVSQAITYVDQLIEDGDPSNDDLARRIAFRVNVGLMVPEGWIPLDTIVIYYQRDHRGTIVDMVSAYPNPFARSARIAFTLEGEGWIPVDIRVFDVAGRQVRTLMQRDLVPGSHSAVWNGLDDRGAKVASGIYFYRLRTPADVASGKLIVRR